MAESIFKVHDLHLPYHFFSSPALGADIQNVRTPEECFVLSQAFQKAITLSNFLINIWCSKNNRKDIDVTTVTDAKIYVNIANYHPNTVYLEMLSGYVWINFPYLFEVDKEVDNYFKSAYWRVPVTPHAFYCLLRLNITHISKRPFIEYHEKSEFAQHVKIAPKLDAFAETLITNATEYFHN